MSEGLLGGTIARGSVIVDSNVSEEWEGLGFGDGLSGRRCGGWVADEE